MEQYFAERSIIKFEGLENLPTRLRSGARRRLDQRLLGHSGELNLLEHMNLSIENQFNRYMHETIVQETLLNQIGCLAARENLRPHTNICSDRDGMA